MTIDMTIEWKNYHFEELPNSILYEILKLRQEVFIVEQSCAYLDCDGLDHLAIHLCGFQKDTGEIYAYARIFPSKILQEETVIGRVIINASQRGNGLAYQLMQKAEQICPSSQYYLGAQAYLEKFYTKAGYRRSGNNYDEDGIPHLPMKKLHLIE